MACPFVVEPFAETAEPRRESGFLGSPVFRIAIARVVGHALDNLRGRGKSGRPAPSKSRADHTERVLVSQEFALP